MYSQLFAFRRMLPGPWCSQLLDDLEAEVIKVEQPASAICGRHNQPNFNTANAPRLTG